MWQPRDPSGQFPTWPVPGVLARVALLALVLLTVPCKSWRVPSERASCRSVRLSVLFRTCPCRARNNRNTSVYFVSTSLEHCAERLQVCNAGLDRVLAQPSAMADVRKATMCGGTPSCHELENNRKQVFEALPSLRTHPAPDDPTVLGPRLLGAWCMGTGGKPVTHAPY